MRAKTDAQRQREQRARTRKGVGMFRVFLDINSFAEALERSGRLALNKTVDRQLCAIEAARIIAEWMAQESVACDSGGGRIDGIVAPDSERGSDDDD